MATRIWESCGTLLFDKDGTILDFKLMWLGWCGEVIAALEQKYPGFFLGDSLEAWGVNLKTGHVEPSGLLSIGSIRELAESLSSSAAARGIPSPGIQENVRAAMDAAYKAVEEKNMVRALPGIPEALGELHRRSYRMAVVTTDSTAEAVKNLQFLGLDRYFHSVLGCDLVEACKPAPDLVLHACRLLGTQPDSTAVIGDTLADMNMGKAAGARCCIGVASGVTSEEILSTAADVVLKDIGALIEPE